MLSGEEEFSQKTEKGTHEGTRTLFQRGGIRHGYGEFTQCIYRCSDEFWMQDVGWVYPEKRQSIAT